MFSSRRITPSYIRLFDTARDNYKRKSKRAGYPNGYFSWLRHSKPIINWQYNTKNGYEPYIDTLQDELEKCDENHTEEKQVLEKHFRKRVNFKNHAFNTYMLDELRLEFPTKRWGRFTPKKKRIVFMRGKTVYRGTLDKPKYVFEDGFIDVNHRSVESYIKRVSGSIGISTSKSYGIAKSYAIPYINPHHPVVRPYGTYGYVYEINYRGSCGVDIEKTYHYRGTLSLATSKEEVNVIKCIPSEDIVRAVKVYRSGKKQKTIDNPNYKNDEQRELADEPMSHFLPVMFLHNYLKKRQSLNAEQETSSASDKESTRTSFVI